MAKPKPPEEKPEPKLLKYEVLQPLLNRETNTLTEPGAIIEMKEDKAEVLVNMGAIQLARRITSKKEK